jgi:myo-inositol-1(or 4)-monophosphatase
MNAIVDRLEFANSTARYAGELALRYFNDLSALKVHSKGVQDMASEADLAVENVIREAIAQRYPEDAFLGEESSADFRLESGKGTWIVDPIDGTQPFINGIRSWCIAIAFVEGASFRLGVVFDPVADEMFAAHAGGGATLNGKPIQVADAHSLGDGMICVGYSNRVPPEATLEPLTRLMHADGMYHRNGSGALSLAYVAAGRLIGYFEPHMNAWDFAAGALIVREAGGRINDCLPTPQSMIDGGPMIAGAPGIYDALCKVIAG